MSKNINMELLENSIDTFSCDIDCAHGVIVCIRAAAEGIINEQLNTFMAELVGIERHLELLVDIFNKETDSASFSTDTVTVLDIQRRLQRLLWLFDGIVSDAPCDEDTLVLHRKIIGAAFAAYSIVRKTKGQFDEVVGNET